MSLCAEDEQDDGVDSDNDIHVAGVRKGDDTTTRRTARRHRRRRLDEPGPASSSSVGGKGGSSMPPPPIVPDHVSEAPLPPPAELFSNASESDVHVAAANSAAQSSDAGSGVSHGKKKRTDRRNWILDVVFMEVRLTGSPCFGKFHVICASPLVTAQLDLI